MITQRKAANAVGGKTARACDSCLRKRARWYCAADDAFLCRGCDASVHSANQLASRHERVRLGTASFKGTHSETTESVHPPPSWHQGFTRKARTPRQRKDKEEDNNANTFPLVPEMGSEEASLDENEEQLLYRVPVFDPFAAELCNVSNDIENVRQSKDEKELPYVLFNDNIGHIEGCELDNNIHGFLPSDMELAEFAADVESLLGTGLDEDSCGMEGLGLRGCSKEGDDIISMDVVCFEGNRVKVEDEEVELGFEGFHMNATRETLDWNFDYESPAIGEEEKVVAAAETKMMMMMNPQSEAEVRRKIVLKLNYEEVITAWDNQGSPWTTGTRPDFNLDDCLPDFMGMWPADVHHPYGSVGGRVDGGREARVSRYREKRRTRLFSKKIRYEVRKLNAEKRPRMKGRFVKRASFAGPSALPNYLINK